MSLWARISVVGLLVPALAVATEAAMLQARSSRGERRIRSQPRAAASPAPGFASVGGPKAGPQAVISPMVRGPVPARRQETSRPSRDLTRLPGFRNPS
mgnify:CR=1 FL=1